MLFTASATDKLTPDSQSVTLNKHPEVCPRSRPIFGVRHSKPDGHLTELIVSDSPGPRPILNIIGASVALGPLRRDLLPYYERWINDFEVTRTLSVGWLTMTSESESEWYEHASRASDQVTFTVYERPELRPIGNAGLIDIDFRHGTAEFGIMIGEKDCWGKGYGSEVTRLVVDYAFTGLGLHNVMLRCYATNTGGIRAYTKAGFKLIGRRREARRNGLERVDTILMDCLASDVEPTLVRKLLD
jgi:RimJ/RimL family protein N-acetyltransferase